MLISSRFIVDLLRYKAIIIAKPIAASAAATVIIKNTNIWPFKLPKNDEKVTKTKFTEFNISSMHIKTTIALRLKSTPTTPIENKRSANTK